MTDPKLNAHEAWMAVMEDVRAIRKGETTSGGSRFNFRGVDTVMNEVGPIFRKHGVSCVPISVEAKHRDFESGKNKTTMHEAIVTVGYRVTGPDGSTFDGMSIGESSDASDKATSQAMSVALRTFLLQGLTMPTDEVDPDHNEVDRAPIAERGRQEQAAEAPAPKPEFTDEERKGAWAKLYDMMRSVADKDFSEIAAWQEGLKMNDLTLTRQQAAAWYDKIAAAPKKAEPDPPTTGREAGWRSDAERQNEYDALSARHDLMVSGLGYATDLDKPDPATMTRTEAEDWLEAIISHEQEAPFD